MRFHLHDRAGNQTLTLTSAGADLSALTFAGFTASIGSTDTVTTFATFSARGEALATVEPDRLLATGAATVTIERERSYNAFGEVASETDARGNVTEFEYNAMGRLTEKKAPEVSVTAEDGGTATIRPTETYGYDIAGRLVAVTDANGHATTRLLLAGTGHQGTEALVREEYHPDTGVAQTKYDVFRDARVTINEVGNTEQRSYDKLGRLVQQEHAARSDGVQLIDHYAYDAAGQRTKHWLSQGGTTLSGISSYAETTDYDVEGRVVRTVQMGGDTTQYRYAWNAGLETSLGELGGWDKVTINPAGLDMTERHDLFGRLVDKSDYGDHDHDLTYDQAGRLVTQTIDATTTTSYAWYNSGLQASVTTGTAVSTFAYDQDGNRTAEKHLVGTAVYQDATATWDALNRMTTFDDAGVSGGAPIDIDYEYDAVGNVRRRRAEYRALDAQGAVITAGDPVEQDNWYLYDEMNRVTHSQGLLRDGTDTGDDARGSGTVSGGKAITYDEAGRRATVTERVSDLKRDVWVYTDGGIEMWHEAPVDMGGGGSWSQQTVDYEGYRRETYSYTADGQLDAVHVNQDAMHVSFGVVSYTAMDGSAGTLLADHAADALGRVTNVKEYTGGAQVYERSAVYDAGSRLTGDVVTTLRGGDTHVSASSYHYNAALNGSGRWDGVTSGGSYMGGVVTWVETDASKNGVDADAPDTRTVHEFVWAGGAVTKNTTHDTDTGSGADTLWETWYSHDALGNLTLAEIDDGRPRDVSFVVDAEGRVLQRDEADGNTATGDPRELHYYFAGRRVGDISNDGTANTDYVTGIASRTAAGGTGPFRGGGATSIAYADFDQGYDAINGSHAPTATRYTVQAGDTLAGIAQAMWGDACLWYRLAEANGLSPAAPLAPGVQLTIPSGVTRTRHAADTFRPYDPNSAIGDLNPAAAAPAGKGNKCGTFGAIISTVVAVALTSLLGPVPGNILSQAFNNLIGTQRGFSFKSLAIAAISAGITGGLEGVNILGSQAGAFANDVVRGALANGLTQGVSVATGLQSKFDFAGVAAAGVVSGVGGAVSRAMVGKWERNAAGIVDKVRSTWNQAHGLGNQLVSGMASGIAGGAARSLATGTSFGDNVMAVLPDVVASTLGRAIAGEISGGYRAAAHGGTDGRKDPFEWLVATLNAPADAVSDTTSALVAELMDDAAVNGGNARLPSLGGNGGAWSLRGGKLRLAGSNWNDIGATHLTGDPDDWFSLGWLEGSLKPIADWWNGGTEEAQEIVITATKEQAAAAGRKRGGFLNWVDSWAGTNLGGNNPHKKRDPTAQQRAYEANLIIRASSGPKYAHDEPGSYFFAPDHPITGQFTLQSRMFFLRASDTAGGFVNGNFGKGTTFDRYIATPGAHGLDAVYRYTLGPGTLYDTAIVKPFYGALDLIGQTPLGDPGTIMSLESNGLTRPIGAVGTGVRELVDLRRAATAAENIAAKGTPLTFDRAARSWTTPEGLIYEQGSIHGNRVKHLLDHTVPNPSKPMHSIFDAGRSDVMGLVDEAWVTRIGPGKLQPNGNRVWTVDMGRQVGTSGQTGIHIVIKDGTTKLITAFPK